MKKFTFRITLTLITAFMIFVQLNNADAQAAYQMKSNFDGYRTSKISKGEFSGGLSIDDIYGNPFLESDFVKGNIFTIQKIQYVDIPIRYNKYSDVFEFNAEDGVYELGVPTDVEKIEFNGRVFHYIQYFDDKKLKYGYFEVIEAGKTTLYARHKVIFKKMEPASLTQTSKPNRFEDVPVEYYLKFEGKEAEQFKTKKELINLFADNRDKVEDFIARNKIKLNNPESLKELVKFYNSL